MKINTDECEIEIVENKDGSRTILLDGQFYVPLVKKDVTLDRLKPTRNRLNKVGKSLVKNREELEVLAGAVERTFNEMKDMRTRQFRIEDNLVKIAETLAKMDLGYNNQ